MINDDLKNRIKNVVNAFEMGSKNIKYAQIYIYRDGPKKIRQITLSFGITEYGNLKKLIQLYIADNGKYSEKFKPFVSSIGSKPLVDNAEFKKLLILSSKEDEIMRKAQDKIYDIAYWEPAYEWFLDHGFNNNLSLAIIMDSFVHSGGILGFLRNRFNANTPNNGGGEEEWIRQYLLTRRKWLANHSNPILRGTVYRIDFFLKHVGNNNWEFNCPMTAHGVNIC
jgi:chitosanase